MPNPKPAPKAKRKPAARKPEPVAEVEVETPDTPEEPVVADATLAEDASALFDRAGAVGLEGFKTLGMTLLRRTIKSVGGAVDDFKAKV